MPRCNGVILQDELSLSSSTVQNALLEEKIPDIMRISLILVRGHDGNFRFWGIRRLCCWGILRL